MREPVSGLRRGAPGGSVNKAKKIRLPISPHKEYFNPRDSSAAELSGSTTSESFGGVYGPRRGSTHLSVISETTTVSITTEAIENQKFAVREIERFGFRMWMASFVIPVKI